MLNNLTIKDFQSHIDTSLELHPNYNVILGQSGCGKTAIIRALKLILYNKPNGTNFVRRPDGEAAHILLSSGTDLIERKKGAKVNEYVVNGSTFNDFGTTIPEDVLKRLPIQDVIFDENLSFNIQFAEQFDAPFLLLESPANKAKFLNKLTGTYVINQLIKDFNDDVRSQSSKAKVIEEELISVNTAVETNKKLLDCLTPTVEYLKTKNDEYQVQADHFSEMSAIKVNADKVISLHRTSVAKSKLLSTLNAEALSERIRIFLVISDLAKKLQDTSAKLTTVQKNYTIYSKLDVTLLNKIQVYSNLLSHQATIYRLRDTYIKLKNIKESLSKVDFNIPTKTTNFDAVRNTLHKLMVVDNDLDYCIKDQRNAKAALFELKEQYSKELAKTPTCPTCGSSIGPTQIQTFLDSI